MSKKRIPSFVLALTVALSCVPVSSAYAVESIATEGIAEESYAHESVTLSDDTEDVILNRPTEDSSELLYNYMLTQSGVIPMPDEKKSGVPASYVSGVTAGSKLTGNNAAAYNYLKTQIKAIAAGTRTSTIIEIPFSELDVKTGPWTKAELGVDALISGSSLTDAARQSLRDKVDIDFRAVFLALLADCPYEMYWCKKTNYSYNSFSGCQVRYENGEETITMTGGPSLTMYVSTDYSVNGAEMTTEVPEGQLSKVTTAITNANILVDAASEYSGKELLNIYRMLICELADYDYNATGGGAPYGDPWQLIYVFDNDPSTNVVCEGYAKAFKYLCDLSSARLKKISCLIASGQMISDDVSGNHMWNVVNMEDNRSYLVDITQCDANTYSVQEYTNTFFMNIPASGNIEDGYTVHFPGAPVTIDGVQYQLLPWDITYKYDNDTLLNYQEQYLTLSSKAYTPVATDITVEFVDVNGIKEMITVANIDDLTLPHPALDGFDFEGWKINDVLYDSEEAVKAAIEASSDDTVTVRLIYAKKQQYYHVSVKNGKLSNGKTSGKAQVSQYITVTTNEAASGKKFSHWLRNGVKVSSNERYSFRMPSQNISLKAVYVNDTESAEKSGTAIIESIKPDVANSKVSFTAVLNVPEGCSFVKGGLVATNNSNIGEDVTAENAAYVKLSAKATANTKSLKYTWTKSNVTEDTIWYVKAYLIYLDNGVEKTVYSDCVKANINGQFR